MSAPGLTLEVARAVWRERALALGYELVTPEDPRRQVVAACVALVSDWTRERVLERVSVTLPGAEPVVDALALVPRVGPALALLARAWGDGRPQVYVAPAAWDNPVECSAVEAHEEAHVLQLEAAARAPLGTLRWVAGYTGAPEVRAIAEGQGYTQCLAARVVLGGWEPRDAAAAALNSLEGYSLEEGERILANAAVDVAERSLAARAMIGGPVLEVLRALRSRGVEVPGWALP